MIMLTAASFATSRTASDDIDRIDESNLCRAAKFIFDKDLARMDKFNADPMNVDYAQHTKEINTKINQGVNTARQASWDTKKAVAFAILDTALTENGNNSDITREFRAVRKRLKASSPHTYKTDSTYLHYAALHTMEALAKDVVRCYWQFTDDERLSDERQTIYFDNLKLLTGIDNHMFMKLFGITQNAHMIGIVSRAVHNHKQKRNIDDKALAERYAQVMSKYESSVNQPFYGDLNGIYAQLKGAENYDTYMDPLTELKKTLAERANLLNKAAVKFILSKDHADAEELDQQDQLWKRAWETTFDKISERSSAVSNAINALNEAIDQAIAAQAAIIPGAAAGDVDTAAAEVIPGACVTTGRGAYFTATYSVQTQTAGIVDVKVRNKPYPSGKKAKSADTPYVEGLNALTYIKTLKTKHHGATVTLKAITKYD